jgi:hypothetical protein
MSTLKKSPPTPLEILNRFYDAERIYMSASPSERDFSPIAATLSPSMKLVQSPDLPYPGEFIGHQGFQKWSNTMADLFDVVDVMEPRAFEKEHADEVSQESDSDWMCSGTHADIGDSGDYSKHTEVEGEEDAGRVGEPACAGCGS